MRLLHSANTALLLSHTPKDASRARRWFLCSRLWRKPRRPRDGWKSSGYGGGLDASRLHGPGHSIEHACSPVEKGAHFTAALGAQKGTRKHREAQRATQRGTEGYREAQSGTEKHPTRFANPENIENHKSCAIFLETSKNT